MGQEETFKIPDKEVKRIKENMKNQATMNKLLSETPEFNEQARLFKTWVALCNIPPNIRCPVCGKGHLTFSCGHGDTEGALKIANKMVQEHSKETKRVHKKIKQEHPELEMIPLPKED